MQIFRFPNGRTDHRSPPVFPCGYLSDRNENASRRWRKVCRKLETKKRLIYAYHRLVYLPLRRILRLLIPFLIPSIGRHVAGMRIPSRQIRVFYTCYHKRFYFSCSFFLLPRPRPRTWLRLVLDFAFDNWSQFKFRIFPKDGTQTKGKRGSWKKRRSGKNSASD